MSEPKLTLKELDDWANRSGITMPGMADTMLRAVYDEIKRLHAENERMEKHVAHNDEEYTTMKAVLRAEHDEAKRLRAENEQLRAIAEAIRDADDDDPVSRIKVHSSTGVNYLRYAADTALSPPAAKPEER